MQPTCYIIGYLLIVIAIYALGCWYQSGCKHSKWHGYATFVAAAAIGLYIGLRPLSIGDDVNLYISWFNYIKHYGIGSFTHLRVIREPIFSFLVWLVTLCSSQRLLFVVVALLTSSGWALWARRAGAQSKVGAALILTACVASSFTCYNGYTNIIRNGMAMPLLMLAVYWLFRDNWLKYLLFGLLAISIHTSAFIFLAIAAVARIMQRVDMKYMIGVFVLFLAVSAMGISILTFWPVHPDIPSPYEIISYYKDSTDYRTGFRPTFALYNTLWLTVILALRHFNGNETTGSSDVWLKLYILASCIFFMWFALPYSDRIGNYSWILIGPLLWTYSQQLKSKYRIIVFSLFLTANCLIMLA